MRWLLFSTAAFGLASVFGFFGCGSAASKSSAPKPVVADREPTNQAEDSTADLEITAALAELPAKDKALAEEQKICPVSGELLGAMGAPVKIDVKGQPVFICCEGCKDKLLAKPDEYLAKLKK